MASVTSPRTPPPPPPPVRLPMTGVISALPVNHRVGGSLENLILKISSRVNDHCCLWGKLLSSMIRYRFERNYSVLEFSGVNSQMLSRSTIFFFLQQSLAKLSGETFGIENLVLNNTKVPWEDIVEVASCLPHLRELHASQNGEQVPLL